MNLVDEYDMLAFSEDFPEEIEKKDKPITEVVEKEENVPENNKTDDKPAESNNNTILIIAGVAVLGIGVLCYFKFFKGKDKTPKAVPDEEDDEIEEETENEDTGVGETEE